LRKGFESCLSRAGKFPARPSYKQILLGIFMNWLKGKKTYIVSTLMFLVSFFNLIFGDISLNEFFSSDSMNLLLEAMGLSTLRAGIKQSQQDAIFEVVKKINFPHAS
jgi:hypothetical protein